MQKYLVSLFFGVSSIVKADNQDDAINKFNQLNYHIRILSKHPNLLHLSLNYCKDIPLEVNDLADGNFYVMETSRLSQLIEAHSEVAAVMEFHHHDFLLKAEQEITEECLITAFKLNDKGITVSN